jgi:CDP-glucose 4,6-dehydratase
MIKNGTIGAWNFGPELSEKYSVLDLVSSFATYWGITDESKIWNLERMPQPSESAYLLLDSTKSNVKLSWENKLKFSQTVEWTESWYKNTNNLSVRENTFTQIGNFIKLA